jgi:hypothetical protein
MFSVPSTKQIIALPAGLVRTLANIHDYRRFPERKASRSLLACGGNRHRGVCHFDTASSRKTSHIRHVQNFTVL